jgi:hypothetical protein
LRNWIIGLLFGVLILPAPAWAEGYSSPEDEIAALKETVKEQGERIEELVLLVNDLRAAQDQTTTAVEEVKKAAPAKTWADNITVKGDLRYRHEMIAKEGSDTRNRHRIRYRLSVAGKVNDSTDAKLRLASGADDPVSTNQTLTGGFSSKSIWLDQAYFDWHPTSSPGLHFYGGKMANPFFVPSGSQLMWDSDLNLEGLAVGHASPLFWSLGYFWVQERGSAPDSMLWAGQLGFNPNFGEGGKLTLGTSYYDYRNAKGYATFYNDMSGFGNTVTKDEDGVAYYADDFNLWEIFGEYSFQSAETPITVYYDRVVNTAADDNDTAWLAGVNFGKCKEPGSWELKYNYRNVEPDAVVGAFCDSDFIGGGTGGKGHVFGIGYQAGKNCKLGLTYFINNIGLDDGTDYKRLQLDTEYKF